MHAGQEYRAWHGVFCTKCPKPFCGVCLEFQFLNDSGHAAHVKCGGTAKLIRIAIVQ